MKVIRLVRIFEAVQFFQNRKPWPECVHSATSPMGIVLPHAWTANGVVAVADGDWILTDTAGRVYHAGQREFREEYTEVHDAPPQAPDSERLQERTEVPEDPRSGGLPDGAAPEVEVEQGGLLRPVRLDSPAPAPPAPLPEADTSQVELVPPVSEGSNPGVSSPVVGVEGSVGLPRQSQGPGDNTHLGPANASSWKYQALKYEAEQDKLRASLGLPAVLGPDGKPVKK